MTPVQEEKLIQDVHDIKMAVVGDRKLGVRGLVQDVESLKKFRIRIMLLLAAVSGGWFVIHNIIEFTK